MTPLEQATLNQILAADPARSAFVMANAGSGKTRVLTNRVARLLLEGTAPDKILCITFTKAAAAEMAERLFNVLGEWALADDDALLKALKDLEGASAKPRDADSLNAVRQLFARALETPGGLKIQTIHSFCEQVLKRFPLEAGAPPGFAIIEDGEAARLRHEAIDNTALDSENDPALASAITRLSGKRNEQSLRTLLLDGAMKRLDFEAALARFDGLGGLINAIGAILSVDPAATTKALQLELIDNLDKHQLERAHDALEASGGNPKKLAPFINAYFSTQESAEKWSALYQLFMTTAGGPRKKLTTKATDKIDPWVGPFLIELQEKFTAQLEKLKALDIFLDTRAYLTLTSALIDRYKKSKAARAALDFDDLIMGTRDLFVKSDAAWVMYKLDQGIDHVLVDEAQDTSPAQWSIIEALLEEMKSGGADRLRSFFAVGDMKQSIYSFQGADAELFEEKEVVLGKALAKAGAYKNFDLEVSFRSTEPVLTFVDALFAADGAADGLGQRGVPAHGLKREGEAGLVALWPLTPRPEKPEMNPWDAPIDEPVDNHPVRVLSRKIAATVKSWVGVETLEAKGRPIAPGDIMILVQSRGPLFDEAIRSLAQAGVPVAGADRLKLLEDPAIEDLLSYARFALLSSDDLSLAEILKSPLFGFDDDADLFPLAYERPRGKSLWASLKEHQNEKDHWRRAYEEIFAARKIGLTEGPYAFFSHILEQGDASGRKRFYKRLSEASRDAIDEMLRQTLDFENGNPRSLRLFVDWFTENAGEIKREMERAHDAVRVMTVHGAKGLQAPIVFLIDAHKGPNIRRIGPVLRLPKNSKQATGQELLSLLSNSKDSDAPITEAARAELKRKAYDEYRRQLYVAATRAEDRLYICGIEQGNQKAPQDKPIAEKTWHALAEDAFDHLGAKAIASPEPFWPDGEAPMRLYACKQTAPVVQEDTTMAAPPIASPSWLFEMAKPETGFSTLAPSRLADEEEAAAIAPRHAPAETPLSGDKYFRGRTLHRLLELLPDITPDERPAAADRLLEKLAPEIGDAERCEWREEVITILHDPQFAPAFAAGSRAEVSIAGTPKDARADLKIVGQIDRLVVGEKDILLIDYKTNRPPPQDVKDVSPYYLAQMAAYRALLQEIYPTRQVKSALIWTFKARLMALPDAMLDHAFARYLAAG